MSRVVDVGYPPGVAAAAAAPVTLALDAATPRGSVALVRGDVVLAEETVAMRSASEERLLPAVAAVLEAAGVRRPGVERVACGAGPGSFTGLRIAAATAKGIAQALGRPLVAVPSLSLVVAGAVPPLPAGRYLATLDALRGERFVQEFLVDEAGLPTAVGAVALLGEGEVAARASARGLTRVGPDEAVALWPHARGVARLAPTLVAAAPVSLRAWEPDYGRLAEAQVKWEAAHQRALPLG